MGLSRCHGSFVNSWLIFQLGFLFCNGMSHANENSSNEQRNDKCNNGNNTNNATI